MKAAFIYALKCPLTGAIRYIGKTSTPKIRLKNHVSEAKRETHHRACWIRSLASKGLRPDIEFLAQIPDDDWPTWEVDYIAALRSLGCDLVNSTDGGEGGRNPSNETRAKQSAAKKGAKHFLFGKKRPPEHCAAISAAKMGEKNPMFGKSPTLAQREKSSVASSGKKSKNNTSGFAGVSRCTRDKRWAVRFRWKGKKFNPGRFRKIEDAVFVLALARDRYCI